VQIPHQAIQAHRIECNNDYFLIFFLTRLLLVIKFYGIELIQFV